MGALADVLVKLVGAPEALLFLGLVAADAAQTKILRGDIEATAADAEEAKERVARLENSHIAADGSGDD